MSDEVVRIKLHPQVRVDSLRIGGQWFYHEPVERAVSMLSDEILTSEVLVVEEVGPAKPRRTRRKAKPPADEEEPSNDEE